MDEKKLLEGINRGDKHTFRQLFEKYYIFLCLIAEQITRSPSDAEEIVSDVFLKLWNNRQTLEISRSLKAYLIKAVQNTSINYLEKNSIKRLNSSLDTIPYELLVWNHEYPLGHLYEQEIMHILERGISLLPENCREIFLLSRSNDLSYSEIAGRLGISVNTVKTQMKIAIARLRETLKDYLQLIVAFLFIKNI